MSSHHITGEQRRKLCSSLDVGLRFPAQTKYLDLMAQSREELNVHHPTRKSLTLLLCCLSLCQRGIEFSDGGRWICSAVQKAKIQVITVTASPESFQKSIYK